MSEHHHFTTIMKTGQNAHLPIDLYTAEQVRQLDSIAINEFRIDGFELMNRAAQAAFRNILLRWPNLAEGGGLQVLCGAGNNGGDGYLVAMLAAKQKIPASVVALKEPEALSGDARRAYEACRDQGVVIEAFSADKDLSAELVVDAMLGTGLDREVEGDYRKAIEQVNHSGLPVAAIDIPSGLSADNGAELGRAVNAELTITFIGMKQGLLTGSGPECCGDIVFADLDVPSDIYTRVKPASQRLDLNNLSGLMQPRRRNAHKGDSGHALLIGGNHGMPGAIIMAAEAAISCGAGKVSVVTRKEHLKALAVRRPEVMASSVKSKTALIKRFHDKSVIVIGPGLGKDDWAVDMLEAALSSDLPVLLDADALNLLPEHPRLRRARLSPIILTPHPGETARLLGADSRFVQQNRVKATHDLCLLYSAVVVHKGAGTLISDGENLSLCSAGNPGMAVAGMGDVLSGVIGALVAQDVDAYNAARLGVWLHAAGADELASQQGELGMLATELIPFIRRRLNRMVYTQ
ncbi:MAG: NAD(P)H-hydrate dehydratase [Endozoicomonas sp.]